MKKISPVFYSILLSLLFFGCNTSNDNIIARIGSRTITNTQLQTFVSHLPSALQSTQTGQAAALDHLNSVVDQELLLQEATSQSLDTLIVYELKTLEQRKLVTRYIASVINPRIQVTEADIERAFVDMGFNQERLLSRILVRTESDVKSVIAALNANQKFEAQAKRFVSNDLFAPAGDGTVGWIGFPRAKMLAIPTEVFFGLPDDQIAQPVQLAEGWQIYRFLGSQEAPLTQYHEEISRLLQTKMRDRLIQEEFEALSRQFKLELQTATLTTLVNHAIDQPLHTVDLAPIANQALYRFANGQLSVGTFQATLKTAGFRTILQDSTQIVDLAQRYMLRPELMEKAARLQGWAETPEYTTWYQGKKRELILRQLIKHTVRDRINPSASDVANFYQQHQNQFRSAHIVTIHEVSSSDSITALSLRQKMDAGISVAELLKNPDIKTHGDRRKNGLMQLKTQFKARYPELIDAAFAAQPGDLAGPVKMPYGYAVFEVIDKQGGEIQPLNVVESRAKEMLEHRLEEAAIKTFIDTLRESNKDRISLFPDRIRLENKL